MPRIDVIHSFGSTRKLGQNAGEFFAFDENVVRPLDHRRHRNKGFHAYRLKQPRPLA